MNGPRRHKPSDKEILVLGIVCMVLAAGLCLALMVALGQEGTLRVEEAKQKMSAAAASATVSSASAPASRASRANAVRPARMRALVADLGNAEMDLRYRRGIAMLVSMAIGLGIFLGLRALRSRPIGPVVFAAGQGGTA